jgi:hypothetical protein
MPATDYSELQGMPKGCTQTSPWGYSPVPVLVPYGPVNEEVVQLAPLVHSDWAAHPFMSPESAYFTDMPPRSGPAVPEGGLGYDSAAEKQARGLLMQRSRGTKTGTAFYHPAAKDTIVALAAGSEDQLRSVIREYKRFEEGGEIVYPTRKIGAYPAGEYAFPLSVPDEVVAERLTQVYAQSPWQHLRNEARQKIRKHYHKAVHLLWCALYGKAQSESYRGNKKIYEQRYKKTGMGLAGGPVAPPPVEPSEFLPPLKDPYEPEPIPPDAAPPGPPEGVPTPTPGPLPTPAGMPLVAKLLLGAALATALGAGGIYVYNRLRA